ncbi:uncharacterized protein LOC130450650 [Diorhabda sublineata]|uniref:uncharacterized protein LOC130450650 n=1 Tax=Diorhabda sublineata TaxID=1163346 RepID=UPI0024E14D48|nr:uncharacterized protein LOC130450650 [Diorhabda sublineata]
MAYATAVQQGIDILVTGEPNKRRTKEANWIKDSRHNAGVLILNIKLGVINHVAGDGHVIIKLKDLELICCYISPNIRLEDYKTEVNSIMEHITNNSDAIILGDLNAKSPMWGSSVTDEKGQYWVEWINARDLVVLNTGNEPTFIRGDSESFIDATIATNRVSQRVTNWEILDTETLTEHRHIAFEIKVNRAKIKTTSIRPLIDWTAYKACIELLTITPYEVSHETGTKLIQMASKNSTQNRISKTETPYWWNENIAEKRSLCNRLRRVQQRAARRNNLNRDDIEAMKEAYKTNRRELCCLIKESKKKHWNDICKELDNNIWGDAYKLVAKKLNTLKPYELDIEKKSEIVAVLFPPGNDKWRYPEKEAPAPPFTAEELRKVAQGIKCGKSPGIDQIPPKAIKIVADCAPDWLLGMMNKLL